MDETCHGCIHAFPVITEENNPRMECRRYPPHMFVIDDEVWSGFPNAIDRCGEYFNENRADAPKQIAKWKVEHTSDPEQPTHITQYGTMGAEPSDTVIIESTAPLSQHDIDRVVTAFYESDRRNFTSADYFLNEQPVRARVRRIGEPWESEL